MTPTTRPAPGRPTPRQLLGAACVLVALGVLVTPVQWYLAARHVQRTEPRRRRLARRTANRQRTHRAAETASGWA